MRSSIWILIFYEIWTCGILNNSDFDG